MINQFPLTYYDSAYYVYNAFNLTQPAQITWRPLTYSLFMRLPIEVFGFSGAIVFQNFVVALFLLAFARLFCKNFSRRIYLIVGSLLLLTPLVAVGNFLMPDIFSVLAIFSSLGFFYAKTKMRRRSFLLFACLFVAMHYSNVICLLPIVIFHFAKDYRKQVVAGALTLITIFAVRFLFFFPKQSFEESAHYFVFSRFVAFSISEVHFDKVCPEADLVFCKDRAKLFSIWNDGRNPNQIGPGLKTLPSIVKVNQEIIKSRLIWSYFFKGLYRSGEQILQFARPMQAVFRDPPTMQVVGVSGGDKALGRYVNPHLFSREKIESYSQSVYQLFWYVSLVSLLFLMLLIKQGRLSVLQLKCLFYFSVAYLLNSLSIGFLSRPEHRYSNKLIWGFSFMALLVAAEILSEKWVARKSQSVEPQSL